jgi:ABC-type dipeptide/oligopeptide/nickel transport system ATPase subunit
MDASIFFTAEMICAFDPCIKAQIIAAVNHWCTHRTYLVVKKKLFQFFFDCEQLH